MIRTGHPEREVRKGDPQGPLERMIREGDPQE